MAERNLHHLTGHNPRTRQVRYQTRSSSIGTIDPEGRGAAQTVSTLIPPCMKGHLGSSAAAPTSGTVVAEHRPSSTHRRVLCSSSGRCVEVEPSRRVLEQLSDLVLRMLTIDHSDHDIRVFDVHRLDSRSDLLPGVAYQPASRLHALLIRLEQGELGQGNVHLFPCPQLERHVVEIHQRPWLESGRSRSVGAPEALETVEKARPLLFLRAGSRASS